MIDRLSPRESRAARSLIAIAAVLVSAGPLAALAEGRSSCDDHGHRLMAEAGDTDALPPTGAHDSAGTAGHVHSTSGAKALAQPAAPVNGVGQPSGDCGHCPPEECSTDPACDSPPSVALAVRILESTPRISGTASAWYIEGLHDFSPPHWKWPPKPTR